MNARIKTTLLLGALGALLVYCGSLLGGNQGAVIALVIAAVFNFGAYWFSDRIVLAMYRAKQVGAEHPLHRAVARLAQRAGLPMPKVYVIPEPAPNAFATGRSPERAAVAATEGILQALTPEELEGVMAHELAHVKNRDTLIMAVAATIAAAVTLIARLAGWAALISGRGGDRRDGNALEFLALLILAPLVALLIQLAISRAREYRADRVGAEIAGNPRALASALRKIHAWKERSPMHADPAQAQATAHLFIINPFAGGLMSLFATHPPVEQRVARLEALVGAR